MRRVEFEYDPAALSDLDRNDLARVLTADWAKGLTSRDVERVGIHASGITALRASDLLGPGGAGWRGGGGQQPTLFGEGVTTSVSLEENVDRVVAHLKEAEEEAVERTIRWNGLSPGRAVVYRIVAEAGRAGINTKELNAKANATGKCNGGAASAAASHLRSKGFLGRLSGGPWVLLQYLTENVK